jgi:thymidylate kinase
MPTNSVSSLLEELFHRLEEEQISYCVLKNFDHLPEQPGRDVDMWVKAEHLKKCLRIIFAVAQTQGWRFLARFLHPCYLDAGGYFFIKTDGNNQICELDLMPFFHRKGVSYLDEGILPKYRRYHRNGFKVAAPGIEAAAMIFRGGMMGEIRGTDRDKIVHCLKRDPHSFLEALQKPFGSQCSGMILEAALTQQWDFLEKNMSYFQRLIVKRSMMYHSVLQIKQWISYVGGRIKSQLYPSHGIFIVLLGPDGAGKSTIAKNLGESEFVKKAFLKSKVSYRRFQISWIKQIVQKIKGSGLPSFDSQVKDDGTIAPLPPLKAAIYTIYLGLDYLLGHFFLQRFKTNAGLLIFDRYFYDYLVFRDFSRCPRWLLKALARIVPRPDVIIYLKNDAKTIYSRKQEWSLQEIERQVRSYEQIVPILRNCCIIDTSKAIDKITSDIIDIIIEILLNRNKLIAMAL